MPPTATAEPETVLQTPAAVDVFSSRREDLRLVKVAREDRYSNSGQAISPGQGEAIRFKEGRFELPRDPKAKVTLEDNRKVPAGGIREWLLEHPLYGDVEEGFFALPSVAPAPSGEEIAELLRLSNEQDADGLRAFIETEEAGFAREQLLTAGAAALRALETRGETVAQ